ncbi:MAG: hypothetical protein RSB39_09400 [Oscillospiraceae bacterium]
MTQYCRYCSRANQVDDGLVYCGAKNSVMNAAAAKRVNKCKAFELNEIDVFDLNKTYQPQAERRRLAVSKEDTATGTQMIMEAVRP